MYTVQFKTLDTLSHAFFLSTTLKIAIKDNNYMNLIL